MENAIQRPAVCIFNDESLWIAGINNTTYDLINYKTTDGGLTWTSKVNSFQDYYIGDFTAINSNVAWYLSNLSGSIGNIRKTTDGGETWQVQWDNLNFFGNCIYFWDENNGFLMGDPTNNEFNIFTTSDGGNTWTQVANNLIPDIITGEYGISQLKEIQGDKVQFVTNKGRIFKSDDRGQNWEAITTPFTSYFRLAINDDNTMWIHGLQNSELLLWKTVDGGVNWLSIPYTYAGSFINDVFYVPNSGSYLLGSRYSSGSSLSSASNDGGNNWTDFNVTSNINKIDGLNENNIWGVSGTEIFKLDGLGLSTNDFEQNKQIEIFPNPAKDILNITNILRNSTISIVDMYGKLLLNKAVTTINEELDIRALQGGVYVLKIENAKGAVTKIFVNY